MQNCVAKELFLKHINSICQVFNGKERALNLRLSHVKKSNLFLGK